jgi:23S rRNA (adenine2503-C2)-methyltransferase
MIEYLLLKDRTDTADDVQALTELWRGLPVHLNLIPYNPIDGAPTLRATEPAGRRAFAWSLRAAGFTVTIRYSLGADIAAACGQLVREENHRVARYGQTLELAGRTLG